MTHSFPTRRSSDLCAQQIQGRVLPALPERCKAVLRKHLTINTECYTTPLLTTTQRYCSLFADTDMRSEEHTSELQSLMRISYAVFCLNNKIHTKRQNILLKLSVIFLLILVDEIT